MCCAYRIYSLISYWTHCILVNGTALHSWRVQSKHCNLLFILHRRSKLLCTHNENNLSWHIHAFPCILPKREVVQHWHQPRSRMSILEKPSLELLPWHHHAFLCTTAAAACTLNEKMACRNGISSTKLANSRLFDVSAPSMSLCQPRRPGQRKSIKLYTEYCLDVMWEMVLPWRIYPFRWCIL